MKIAHWAAAHRRSLLFLIGILSLGGVLAALKMPVSLFPHVDFPRVVVSVDAGDRPADQMTIAVTRPLEHAVRAVPGVRSLRSTTSRGSAEISINFDWGADMVSAMLQVDSAISQVMPSLPVGTRYKVRRMDPTVFPIAAYSLTSATHSLVQLRDIAQYQLAPRLSSIRGVAKVGVMGGETAEYRVEVDPDKLRAMGLSLTDLAQALQESNTLRAVGRVEDHYKLYLVMSDSRPQTLTEIGATPVPTGGQGMVMLKQLANIYPAAKPQWQKVNADGKDAVLLQIYQQPGANSVALTQGVKKALKQIRATLPKGIKLANWYDQSVLVTESAASVRDAIAIGVVLAAIVLLIFLRSLKVTLIAIIAVPSALACAVLLLRLLHMSFNIMTLGGMAAAVGLIVDDAIVMVEHIIRRLRELDGRQNYRERVRHAAIEFSRPLLGSSCATIIIFLPLAFLSGVTGAFFKALSLTMAASLVMSFLLAWLAVPLLAEHLISPADAQREDVGPVFSRLQDGYRWLLRHLLARPILVLVGLVPLVLVGVIAYRQVGTGFMPSMDEGGFVLDYVSASGTSLSETDRLLRQVEKILQENPAVQTYSRRTGLQLGGGLTEANEGDFFVRLKLFPRPPIDEVMSQIRQRIDAEVPGLNTEMALLMEDMIGDLTAVPQPIEIKLYSDDQHKLMQLAPKVASAISDIRGVVDVNNGIHLAGDAVDIKIDASRAAQEGMTPAQVSDQLNAWTQGVVATQVQQGVKMVGVRVWVPRADRDRVSSLKRMWLRAPDGHRVPLSRVASISLKAGQPQIVRDNLKRMIAVTGRISGRDLGSTIRAVNQRLHKPGLLPKGVYYKLGGLYKEQQAAFRGLVLVFAASLALVFVLLLFLYEDFAAALAIISSPLLAIAAVFTGLWVTGIELSITAMMGMTMIVGIVTEVSIFYFSEYHDRRAKAESRARALVIAGSNRLRPIVMTTLAAILALMPLALGLGQGSAMQQPLAVAIIAGLIVQIPLVTLVMPLFYVYLSRVHGLEPGGENAFEEGE